jgi:hypothetical protein
MKRKFFYFFLVSITTSQLLMAQTTDESGEQERRGFKKERLFTGGNITLSFFNNTFLAGASPIFGYSVTNWADVGAVVNISYSSTRDYGGLPFAKLRQTIYGGGAFVRLFPVNFLFAQAQAEHNFISYKFRQAIVAALRKKTEPR